MSTDGGVCHVRLNRPDKMNALDPAMFEGITSALAELAADASIRVIVSVSYTHLTLPTNDQV